MTDHSRNIMVGLTAITGLVGVSLLFVLFGEFSAVFNRAYVVHVEMPDAGGLNDSSRITLHGIDVGQVEQVQLLPLPKSGVRLTLRIRPEVKLPRDMRVYVERPLLGGSAALAIDLGGLKPAELNDVLPTNGAANVVTTEINESFEDKLAKELHGAMDNAVKQFSQQLDGPRKRLDEISQKFSALSDEWVTVGKNVNLMVQPRTPGQVDDGKGQPNLASVLARTDARLAELKVTIAGIDKWANDPKLRDDFRATVANAAKASEKFDATLKSVQDLTASANANFEKLTTRFVAVADDLTGAIDSMHATIDQIKNGKGAVGKFINDPALYDNLNDSAVRVGKALDEMKLLMEKWKAEGVTLHF